MSTVAGAAIAIQPCTNLTHPAVDTSEREVPVRALHEPAH
jgi:hypothetical protein